MRLSVLRGGSRKSDRGAGLGLSGGGAAPFSPGSSSTASVKLLPKNSMTKSMGAPPLLWLCLYHLFPRTVRLSCRFHRYSFPARVSCSPCDCREETRSAWLARSICSWVYYIKVQLLSAVYIMPFGAALRLLRLVGAECNIHAFADFLKL